MNKQQYIEQLFNTLAQLKKLLQSQAKKSHEEKAASLMQFSALKFLRDHKNSTVGDVADHLNLSKSSSTQLIERLAIAGLVKRLNDQADRRIVHVTITSGGEQELVALKKRFLDRMGKIFSKIPEEDLRELIRLHNSLIEKIQKENNG